MEKDTTNITDGSEATTETSQDSAISSREKKGADQIIHHTRDLVHKAGHYVQSYGLMAGSFVLGVAVAVIVVRRIVRRAKR